jgi:hypothetical protein
MTMPGKAVTCLYETCVYDKQLQVVGALAEPDEKEETEAWPKLKDEFPRCWAR